MSMTKEQARELLHGSDLRATAPRIAVLRTLAEAETPLSHTEVVEVLGVTDWDPATIYRNLVKLRDAGLAPVVSQVGGIDRYALLDKAEDDHHHPHFVCEDCGKVSCLPIELTTALAVDERWKASIQGATMQLSGECPECLEVAHKT